MLQPATSYHIYNHGNGIENIFKEEKNYAYFLKKYREHIPPIAHTEAYCLMPNHFHLLVRIKSEEELEDFFSDRPGFKNLDGLKKIEKYISQTFSNFFNSYTKSFNKVYDRRGSLFLKNFKLKPITSEDQWLQTLLYIHLNPVKHGFINDHQDWIWSSFHLPFNHNYDPWLSVDNIQNHFRTRINYFKTHNEKRASFLR